MSNPTSQSRLSVDLGVGKKIAISRSVRQNPPRLQHSPSLPNIWFPPHSGPLPSQITSSGRNPLQRPSTPPPNMATPVTQREAVPDINVVQEPENATPLVATGECTSVPCKNSMRGSTSSDTPHSLLTPPLTPSSSIATRSDSTGTRDNDTQATSCTEEGDCEPEASRFLLVSNVSRHLRPDALKTAIIASLRNALSKEGDDPLHVKKSTRFSVDDIVKGVFVRCQESHGIVMLAFYDVRDAKFAKSVLSSRTSGALAECVDNRPSGDDAHPWLGCRFITSEELMKTIGNSTFLSSTDGRFYVTIEGDDYHDFERAIESNGKIGFQESDLDANGQTRKLNLDLLKKYLEAFGGLRYFTPADLPASKEGDKDRVKSFCVEYFDTREADSASSQINQLGGQAVFGMKLKIYRREIPDIAHHRGPTSEHLVKLPPSVHREDAILSSQNDKHRCKDNRFRIPLPGQLSLTRERFAYDGPPVNVAEVGVSHKSTAPTFYPANGTDIPSPTYFYTSNPGNMFSPTMRESNGHLYMVDNNYFVSNVVDAPGPVKHDLERSQMQHTENGIHEAKYWNGDYQNTSYHFYYPRPDCFYYPLQKDSTSNGRPFNGPPSMTPTSAVYYAPIQPGVQSTIAYPFPQQVASVYGLEHESGHIHHPAGVQNWGLDHATAVATAPGPPPVHATIVPGVEHWYPDSQAALVPGPYYSPQIPNPQSSHVSCYPKIPFGSQISSNCSPLFIPTARTPTPPAQPGSPISAPPSLPRESAPPPERNQLNLARIEDGQDTRTTVMIKNIPNKMSDKDLLTFIHKVCPRRIDFLYLRMDFKNGCNVGYAFVNFIHVQDLLTFAKKKLGEKWNMFSSEKVLQMSYANYQGKEALVEKFKNSCIMDEREAWRPKIFYSEGPAQGLPEPFPAPTHLRRKERSSHNRGALYVPGVGSGLQTQLYATVGPRRQSQDGERRASLGVLRDTDDAATPKRGKLPR